MMSNHACVDCCKPESECRCNVGTIKKLQSQLQAKEQELVEAKQRIIARFDEDEVPSFRQGMPVHELEAITTAEDCEFLVNKIKQLTERIKVLEEALRWYANKINWYEPDSEKGSRIKHVRGYEEAQQALEDK